MQFVAYRDAAEWKIDRRIHTFVRRFKGDWARVYSFLSRRQLSQEECASLGDMLVSGYRLDLSRDDYIRLYPRLTAHMICESLGYCTPENAANIIRDGAMGEPNNCEWIDACYRGDARQCLLDAIHHRHAHPWHYPNAIAIVRRFLESGDSPMLASWF